MSEYFALFALPQRYDIDLALLEQKYFALQRAYHPDNVVGKPETERLEAMQHATTINQAYHILKSPLKRAEYLLEQQGIIVNRDGSGVKPDQSLLMEAMEQREALMEAETTEAILALATQAKQEDETCIAALSTAFDKQRLEEAARLATRLRYLEKYRDEIRIKRLKGITNQGEAA